MNLTSYLRVSTQKQGQSGLGLEAQQAAIKDYAERSGGVVVREFVEVESGRKSARPELTKALAHARLSRGTLCVAKLDRLARNVSFLSAIMDSHVEFVCCDNPHANRFTLHILAAVAEEESRMISVRTKAALAAYKARGGKLGTNNLTEEAAARGRILGRAARALRCDESLSAYADLVPIMREHREAGKSLRQVAEYLNQEGYVTIMGKKWQAQQVLNALNRGSPEAVRSAERKRRSDAVKQAISLAS